MQDMNAFNLQLQMHKTLNTVIFNYVNNKKKL